MKIELREITWDNVDNVVGLEVEESQKGYVYPNGYSLAHAYVSTKDEYPEIPFAIYHDETLVGFTLMNFYPADENEYENDEEACYYISRFMIDKKYQGKGFGRQGMEKVLAFLKTFPQGKAGSIYLSYEPVNAVAIKLYASLGFVETGQIDNGETVARLVL